MLIPHVKSILGSIRTTPQVQVMFLNSCCFSGVFSLLFKDKSNTFKNKTNKKVTKTTEIDS